MSLKKELSEFKETNPPPSKEGSVMNYADKEAVEYDGPANPDRVGYPSELPDEESDEESASELPDEESDEESASELPDEESDEDDCGCCDPHCPCDGHKQLRFL